MARTAKAVAAVDEVEIVARKEVHLVEVELIRKYSPHLCYKNEAGDDIKDDNGTLIPRENPDADDPYPYQKQLKVVTGTTFDRAGREVPKYREIMDDFPAGTAIKLPTDEAHHALEKNIAKVTARTLVS